MAQDLKQKDTQERDNLRQYLGIRDWLYFTVFSNRLTGERQFAELRVDRITNDIHIEQDGTWKMAMPGNFIYYADSWKARYARSYFI